MRPAKAEFWWGNATPGAAFRPTGSAGFRKPAATGVPPKGPPGAPPGEGAAGATAAGGSRRPGGCRTPFIQGHRIGRNPAKFTGDCAAAQEKSFRVSPPGGAKCRSPQLQSGQEGGPASAWLGRNVTALFFVQRGKKGGRSGHHFQDWALARLAF